MRFIDPKTDFAFKKIFSSNESKDILISFLNATVYNGNPVIKDLEIINPENIGNTWELKDSYLDVKAVLSNKSTVIIEMQVENVEAFPKRLIYNLAKTYGNQLKKGQGYAFLTPVIALTITDFKMFTNNNKVINRFGLKEMEDGFNYPDKQLEMVFVELPKFTKQIEELETLTDKWIYFMKEAPSLEMIPSNLGEVAEIDRAFSIANKANLSREELEKADKQEMSVLDSQARFNYVLKEGEIKLISRLMKKRFGEGLDEETIDNLHKLFVEDVEMLGELILDWENREEFSALLDEKLRMRGYYSSL